MSGLGFWFGNVFYTARNLPQLSHSDPSFADPSEYHPGFPPEFMGGIIHIAANHENMMENDSPAVAMENNLATPLRHSAREVPRHSARPAPAQASAILVPAASTVIPAVAPVNSLPAQQSAAQAHATRSCQACRARQKKCGSQLPRCVECVQKKTKCEYVGTVDQARSRAYPDDFLL